MALALTASVSLTPPPRCADVSVLMNQTKESKRVEMWKCSHPAGRGRLITQPAPSAQFRLQLAHYRLARYRLAC